MTDGEGKLVELMSLMLDEQRETRKELGAMKTELVGIRKVQVSMQEAQIVTNDRLEAIEYALTHDRVELRTRIERLESRVAKIEENR